MHTLFISSTATSDDTCDILGPIAILKHLVFMFICLCLIPRFMGLQTPKAYQKWKLHQTHTRINTTGQDKDFRICLDPSFGPLRFW